MNPESGASVERDRLLDEVITTYLKAQERGEAPDREGLFARYPDLTPDLRLFFADQDSVERLTTPLQQIALAVRTREDAGQETPLPAGLAAILTGGTATVSLGDYRLLREIGRGGMGVVYEAEQRSLGRRVALKVLPFAATMDPRQVQRFHNEARAAACLHHSNIVPVFGVGCEQGIHFYAMQLIEGQTLTAVSAALRRGQGKETLPCDDVPTTPHTSGATDALASTGARPGWTTAGSIRSQEFFRSVARLGVQAAEALDYAHQMGVVHRDIKPGNLMLDGRGDLWVTDFGLAQLQQGEGSLTLTGDLVGTLRYMSPEQALARRVLIDHRTDVYSLGATLYELLTLRPAFDGTDRQELLQQVAFEEPSNPRKFNRALPQELETVVLKAMAKNPSERYETAQDLADDLERFLDDRPIRAQRPSLGQRARKWARRHRALVRATMALVLVLVLVGGVLLWREQRQRAAVVWGVESNLERAELLQKQEHWDEALAVLAVAEGELEGHGLGTLRQRVAQSKRDLEMLTRLENARLQLAAAGKGELFDHAGADRLYAEAFAGYGLDLESLSPEEIAQRVRASAIGTSLIAALDNWAVSKEELRKGSGASLRATADLADDDPWRRRLRGAVGRGDGAALERLAEEPGVWSEPTVNLVLLGRALRGARRWGAAARLLQQAQQEHPADFWINFELAGILDERKPREPKEAVAFFRAALALRPRSPAVWINLGRALRDQKQPGEAVAAFKKAIALKPDFPEAYYNLGVALSDQKQWGEAVTACKKAIQLKPDFAKAYNNLGVALHNQKQWDEAVTACKKAIQLKPDHALAYYNLGLALAAQKHLDEAVAAYQKAIRLKPDYYEAYTHLGQALADQKQWGEAITALKKAIQLKPDEPGAYCNLGAALCEQRQPGEAVTAFKKAIALKPDFAKAYNNLGIALRVQRQPGEAVAAFRKAIALKPDLAAAYNNLGLALADQKQLDEAVVAFKKAIQLSKDSPGTHCNLGLLLRDQGQYAEALTYLRRGHELGSRDPRWPYPSAQWVRDCEGFVELDSKLPEILSGHRKPADSRQRLMVAWMCQQHRKLYAAATRFYTGAFADNPQLADDLNLQHRYDAACAAALAGCGQGKDAGQLDQTERARLRQQALDWLRKDLKAYRQLLDRSAGRAGPTIAQRMRHWLQDDDLAGVRGAEPLACLPEPERKAWQKLWTEVQALSASSGKTSTRTGNRPGSR
jgi:tetratricopeptide (TPR) repeat protein